MGNKPKPPPGLQQMRGEADSDFDCYKYEFLGFFTKKLCKTVLGPFGTRHSAAFGLRACTASAFTRLWIPFYP